MKSFIEDQFNVNKLKLNEFKTKNTLFGADWWVERSELVPLLVTILDTGL